MIGLDSNILLRAVLNDDKLWSGPADAFIAAKCTIEQPGYINAIVLAEIVWVLRRRPEFDRQKLADFVEGLLDADNLVIGEETAVIAALEHFRKGKAGFVDYLIAELNQGAGAAPTFTLDGDAGLHGAFSPISPES